MEREQEYKNLRKAILRQRRNSLLHSRLVATGVYSQKYEQQDCEAPKTGTSIAEERQGDADNWREPQYHAHIDEKVEEEHAQHAITIDAPELERLPFGQLNESQYQRKEEQQHCCRA